VVGEHEIQSVTWVLAAKSPGARLVAKARPVPFTRPGGTGREPG